MIEYVLDSGLMDLASEMVKTQAIDMTFQHWKTGLSPVHMIASSITNSKVLDSMLTSVDRNKLKIKDIKGNTPLHYAAYYRNQAMC